MACTRSLLKRFVALLLLLFAVVLPSVDARAAVAVVDQNAPFPGSGTGWCMSTSTTFQQQVTVGIAGQLAAIDVFAGQNDGNNHTYRVIIRNGAGPSSGTAVATHNVNTNVAWFQNVFNINLTADNLSYAVGDKFVIEVTPLNGSGGCSSAWAWSNPSYTAGDSYNNGAANGQPVAFRTYVIPGSSVSVASGTNPSVYGQNVTFTATVSGGAAGDTVTFKDGAATLGTSLLTAGGTAAFSTSSLASPLTVGTHSITATWKTLTSTALSQVVNKANTTTTVSSSANPSVVTQNVTFTATVAAVSPGAGTPTGSVAFTIDGNSAGSGTLNASGQASVSTATLTQGTHTVVATYAGDTNFNTSTNGPGGLTQTVNLDGTTVTMSSNENPSTYGDNVTFTATLVSVGAAGVPTGSVNFYDGTTLLGAGTINAAGVATYSTAALTAGPHTIKGDYLGDGAHKAGSGTVNQVVNQAASTAAITSAPNPSVFGQSVTFTATVTSTAGTPTGTVSFSDNGVILGTATLAGGTATFATTALPVGGHSVTVTYSGDTNFTSSTSPVDSQVVNKAATSTTLIASSNPALLGSPVTFTAHVSPTAPGAGLPTGTVTFTDGAAVIGLPDLDALGNASVTVSTLTAGTHSITASYGGDIDFLGSTSPTLSETIGTNTATLALASSANPSVYQQNVTFTATLSGSAGVPTGNVSFTDTVGGTVTPLGTSPMTAGVATFSKKLNVGTHTITATFAGDTNYPGGAQGQLIQTVKVASTQMTLASNLNPSNEGDQVTFTAELSSTATDISGTVEVFDGATSLGTATINLVDAVTGRASLTTAALTAGSHTLRVQYGGDGLHAPATSNDLVQVVNPKSAPPPPSTGTTTPPAPPPPAATTTPPTVTTGGGGGDGGCSCRTSGTSTNASFAALPLLGLALLFARRRRAR
jgi:MYXO-CTERM domain-containing protein